MFAVDGNDSLKRIAHIGSRDVGDTRNFLGSDYYIPPEEVDLWAREVISRPSVEDGPVHNESQGEADEVGEWNDEQGADHNPCANNWKAAQSDSKKRMWGVFAETGLFASACRHGFILWIADMVQSGEQ